MSPEAKKTTAQASSGGAGLLLETHPSAAPTTITPAGRYTPRLPAQPHNALALQGCPHPDSYDRDAELEARGGLFDDWPERWGNTTPSEVPP